MVHPIMKSSIGLDVFMKYKVESFFKKLDALKKVVNNESMESEEQVNHLFKLMIRFISSTLLFINSLTNANIPDHYIIAKNQLPKYLSYFDKQELLETSLQECKNSQNIFNLLSDYINENHIDNGEYFISSRVFSNTTTTCIDSTNNTATPNTTTNNNNTNILDSMIGGGLSSIDQHSQIIQSPIPLISVINKDNQWIKIPSIESTTCNIDDSASELFESLFGNDIYSQIPNTNQTLNLSSLKSLTHYLINKNSNTFNEAFKFSILKQGSAYKKDVKSFFQNSKLKKRHILLVHSSNQKFKLILFNADGSSNDIFHNEMKPLEEIELSNLCYLTINDNPKKNISISSLNTLTINDRTEKKKWLFEFSNEFERDEWFYMLKYCLLLC
ncbi:pleckstrin-like domain-containing protein [Naegleria gruberi]|uniref:Pleckstrin-like domain-containing protein n=1 Tax=Naegleria gruberi TaxID=5762 RepID=D2UZP6_NAEGR|nr:pleckstrin-like domain-containing protein [Naegleria gruberi]EFC50197.1 pleckstrin-like domain-containing protein [Naegleria gruberi]|eukprot:XP_002682941.1 pleckstrin-like domain-containing protein [Naegleria gruberi strain NEG-M]